MIALSCPQQPTTSPVEWETKSLSGLKGLIPCITT